MLKKILFTLFTLLLVGTSYFYYLFNVKDYTKTDSELSNVLNQAYEVNVPAFDEVESISSEIKSDTPEEDLINKETTNTQTESEETSLDNSNEIAKEVQNTETNTNEDSNQSPTQETEPEPSVTGNEPNESNQGNTEHKDEQNESETTKNTESDSSTTVQNANIEKPPEETQDTTEKSEDSTKKSEQDSQEEKSKDKTITVETIKNKYTVSFEELKEQANQKLNQVVERALEEYEEKLANDEEVSPMYFLTKYGSVATQIEKQTDETFQLIYDSLQKELEKYGFAATAAEELKAEYNKVKQQYQEMLVQKAMEKMDT